MEKRLCNISNFDYYFRSRIDLRDLDLSHWDTSNVKSLRYCFIECKRLESLGVASWDTSNVEDMEA